MLWENSDIAIFWFSVVSDSVNSASFQTLVLTGRLFEPLTYKIFKDVQLKKVLLAADQFYFATAMFLSLLTAMSPDFNATKKQSGYTVTLAVKFWNNFKSPNRIKMVHINTWIRINGPKPKYHFIFADR